MAEGLEKVKDGIHTGLDEVRGCLGDLLSEVLVALAACGLLALGWWGLRAAPYPTVSIAVGVLLFAAHGVIAYRRDARGTKLAGRLAVAGLLAAAAVVLMLTYLPYCYCLG
ncbi:MAG TPA: hypothetical protein VFY84_01530 [Jiangellales bacterium]|nr:hypothetical protein [Jiangellales bacterium]